MASEGSRGVAKPVEEIWDGRLGIGSYQIIPSTSSSCSVLNSLHDVPMQDVISFNDVPSTLFPSLDPKNRFKFKDADKFAPSVAQMNLPSSHFTMKQEVVKRPVGRPRIHPVKYVDPNRIKRGTKLSAPVLFTLALFLFQYLQWLRETSLWVALVLVI